MATGRGGVSLWIDNYVPVAHKGFWRGHHEEWLVWYLHHASMLSLLMKTILEL